MADQSDIRILVHDDEPCLLKLLARMLADQGFTQVTSCASGQLVLEAVDRPDTTPDLILMDLNVPVMDGVEFVRHLVKHHYPGSFILVSGEDERLLQSAERLVHAHRITVLDWIGTWNARQGESATLTMEESDKI